MKTAQEMYQFCIDNNYGTGLSKKWAIYHFSIIENALDADEDVIMCFIGLHRYESSSQHNNNFAYAITEKRILLAQQKMIGQVFQTIDIDNLNDITMSTGLFSGLITIDTIKEKFNIGVDSIAAQKINDSIHNILFSLKHKNSDKHASFSPADEILKYKNLLDIGAITQDEFNKKKAELLGV